MFGGFSQGQAIANAAVAEKIFWAGGKETVANNPPEGDNELFERMTAYWALCGIKAPQWGPDPDPSLAAQNTQTDNFN